ncbi:transporter [Agarivorans sp. OAG1]|uniref:HlyD family secretion protein n=1 Tax=Agarivorans sp. OAG1 TaxID=3082387 RepID=UPI002B2DDB20|nr:transporter [Agarivorans sp. OAG1]
MSKQSDSNNNQLSQSDSQTPLKILTLVIASLCLLLLTWYLIADRVTPFTDNSRTRAYVVPLSPVVAGRVVDLLVENNQVVQQGQVVARIDPERYQLAVNKAEASLELAGQEIGIKTASVATAQARLAEAVTSHKLTNVQSKRIFAMGNKGYVSQAEIDEAASKLSNAQAHVDKMSAELEKAKLDAGISGDENPRIKKALTELLQAQVNLEDTTVRAPRLGLISNVRYDVGVYVNPGQALMSYISTKDIWLEAYLRENSLSNLKPGNQVEMVFDSAPGKIYQGRVKSISFGVEFEASNQVGSLQTPIQKTGWLREAQRFPVIIDFAEDIPKGVRREGGQVDVIVYTSDSGLMKLLGKLYIRLMGVLSYVY